MSATVTPRWNAATLIRPRSSGVTSIVSRAVKRSAFASLFGDGSGSGPMCPGRSAAPRRHVFDRGPSSRDPFDLGDERGDIAHGWFALRHLADEPSCTRRIREDDTLADSSREHRWLMVGQRFRRLPGNDGAGAATVEDEARNEQRPEQTHFLQ